MWQMEPFCISPFARKKRDVGGKTNEHGLTNACTRLLPAVASLRILLSRNGSVLWRGSLPVIRGVQQLVMRGVKFKRKQ